MSDIGKAIKNVGDAVDEGINRSKAEGEHAKREIAGDAMTPGEKLGSMANEAKSNVKAEINHGSRSVRDAT